MKIGDEVYIHGYIDEIRKDTIIIRNEGGYFGTVQEEISVKQEPKTGHWIVHEHAEEFYGRVVDNYECNNCGDWYLNKTNFCPNCGCNMSENPTGSKDVIWYSKRNYSEIVVEPQERSE